MNRIPKNITPLWIKTIKLIPRYAYLSILRTSEFKFNFYSYLFLYAAQIVFYIFFWKAVGPPIIGGWSTECYFLLTGFVTLNIALQEIVWATGMLDFMILKGDLLVVLARPENSYFGLVLRRMGAMALLPAFLGLLLILITLWKYFSIDLLRLSASLLCCLAGAVSSRAVLVAVNSLSFKFGRIAALKSFVLGTRDLARYPLNILHPILSSLLIFMFPAMLISTWPTLVLQISTPMNAFFILASSLVITCIWVCISAWCWTKGLRSYEGVTQ